MPTLSAQQFLDECFRLYETSEHAACLARLEAGSPDYPEAANTIYNWQICCAALLGQKEKAMRLLEEALESGQFWAGPVLRDDPDLATLRGDPEFERLVDAFHARFEAAAAAGRPERLVFAPGPESPRPYPLLLAMHGRNQNAALAAPRWQGLAASGWLVAVLQSSQPVGSGIYAWDDHEKAGRELADHLAGLRLEYPVDEDRIVLAGFSQGGGTAIREALKGAVPARGLIGVAPWLPDAKALAQSLPGRTPAGLRAYLVTGGQDQGAAVFTQIEALLAACGVETRREHYPDLGHEFPPDFPASLRQALDFLS